MSLIGLMTAALSSSREPVRENGKPGTWVWLECRSSIAISSLLDMLGINRLGVSISLLHGSEVAPAKTKV